MIWMKGLCLYERDQIFDARFSGIALAVAWSMVAPVMSFAEKGGAIPVLRPQVTGPLLSMP